MIHPHSDRVAGYKLLENATLVNFEVIKSEVSPAPSGDIVTHVEIQLAKDEDGCDGEWGGLGFMFALAVLSLADARPHGYGVN